MMTTRGRSRRRRRRTRHELHPLIIVIIIIAAEAANSYNFTALHGRQSPRAFFVLAFRCKAAVQPRIGSALCRPANDDADDDGQVCVCGLKVERAVPSAQSRAEQSRAEQQNSVLSVGWFGGFAGFPVSRHTHTYTRAEAQAVKHRSVAAGALLLPGFGPRPSAHRPSLPACAIMPDDNDNNNNNDKCRRAACHVLRRSVLCYTSRSIVAREFDAPCCQVMPSIAQSEGCNLLAPLFSRCCNRVQKSDPAMALWWATAWLEHSSSTTSSTTATQARPGWICRWKENRMLLQVSAVTGRCGRR
jgi:hypothetical protein